MLLPDEKEHFIDYFQIKRDVFILLHLGYGFDRLRSDDENDVAARKEASIFSEYGLMYEAELSLRLINIGVQSRILDDRIVTSKPDLSAAKFVYEDMLGDDDEGNPINLRQCMNKIIHARSIDHERMHLPEIFLYGQHSNGESWSIRIFIMPFCTAMYQWVSQFQVN